MIKDLQNWIKNIVIIIIFANLFEMLLPDTSLRKYIRLVMGFMILLTLLTPLLSIFKADLMVFMPIQPEGNELQTPVAGRSVEEIEREKEELVIATYERQLEKQMEGLILDQPQVATTNVQVTATGNGQILSIEIQLSLQDALPEDGATASHRETDSISPVERPKAIEPVTPINISIHQKAVSSPPQKNTLQVDQSQRVMKVQKQIRQLLTNCYSIKPETIVFL